MNDELKQGHYARKQIFCPSKLIGWSHRRRFETALVFARPFAGQRVLDYGCGDGTYLAMLMRQPDGKPASAVGAEIDPRQVKNCRERFKDVPGLDFIDADELLGPAHQQKYDAVICMEVLEHVVELDAMLDMFERLLAPKGHLLISVPVEVGAPLIVKQIGRRIAGWCGLGDYPGTSPYTFRQLFASLAAGEAQHIERPVHRSPDGFVSHDHKGFNWMALRKRLAAQFDILQTGASPINWLSPHLASQAWFVARKRDARG